MAICRFAKRHPGGRAPKIQSVFIITAFVASMAVATRGLAQSAATIPPVRQLGPQLARLADTLGWVTSVHQLADGRLFVADQLKHRLLLVDSALSHSTVVADTTSTTRRAYGSMPGKLIGYLGDSTIFVDGSALALLVIDPGGKISRVMALPRPNDMGAVLAPFSGAAIDGRGWLVYKLTGSTVTANGGLVFTDEGPNPPANALDGSERGDAVGANVTARDSVAIVRVDFTSRRVDTLGFVDKPVPTQGGAVAGPNGIVTITRIVNPIPVGDDWAVLSDGSVAFVRARDYHIDWIDPNGSRSATPPIPHTWRRLTDSAKVAIVDSIKRGQDSAREMNLAARQKADSMARAGGRPQSRQPILDYAVIAPNALPDYAPPFAVPTAAGPGVWADADDHLWIPEAPRTSSPIYDIVDRRGRLVDRMQLPATLNIAGFGRGVIYLFAREGAGVILARYRAGGG
jgi:hypothetical protein